MKKRITLLTVSILCVASIAVGVAAASVIKEIKAQLRPDFTVVIDGKEQTFKTADGDIVYPVLHEGTTYLPIRAIGEIMDKLVYWFEDDKRIELRDKNSTVTDADVIIGGAEDKTDVKVFATDKTNFIGEERAKAIALEKAGIAEKGTAFFKVELDYDKGIWHYEIEFRNNKIEYEADINAETGEIIKFEKDFD